MLAYSFGKNLKNKTRKKEFMPIFDLHHSLVKKE
jgi:hypothetical protein